MLSALKIYFNVQLASNGFCVLIRKTNIKDLQAANKLTIKS